MSQMRVRGSIELQKLTNAPPSPEAWQRHLKNIHLAPGLPEDVRVILANIRWEPVEVV